MIRIRRTPLMTLAAGALCAAAVGCHDAGRPVLSREKDPKSMKPAELQQFVSTKAALAGANAGAALTQLPTEPLPPPAPALPPVPTPPSYKAAAAPRTVVVSTAMSVPETTRRVSPPAVKITNVRSERLHRTEQDARYDALGVASVEISRKLRELNPPIDVAVNRTRVWNEYVSQTTAKVVPATDDEMATLKNSPVSENTIRYGFDVEISEAQLRDLRGMGRSMMLAPFALAGLALCFGANVLLKLTGAAAAAVRRG